MPITDEALRSLRQIPNLQVFAGAPLAPHTRFGLGGPADVYAETDSVSSFLRALEVDLPHVVIGGGTNLVVSDDGYRGLVLRFTARGISAAGACVTADAGAELQQVVDFSVERGLAGVETLAGIPGSLGAAIYGNAGAYGRSISESVQAVTFFDGAAARTASREECGFRYRESAFKRNRGWIVFSAQLALAPGDAAELRRTADEIVALRNAKFPPEMKCAGSVFKNLLAAELPPALLATVPDKVIREGKIPAAYFLERAGAKGLAHGDIHVADYHANLIYNGGGGTAADFRALVDDLKSRVQTRFGLALEEEVQYLGF